MKVLKLTTHRDVEEFHRVRVYSLVTAFLPYLSSHTSLIGSCLQEIQRLRFLSGLPNVVTSLPYRPRHTSRLTVHLVMELMEVRHR